MAEAVLTRSGSTKKKETACSSSKRVRDMEYFVLVGYYGRGSKKTSKRLSKVGNGTKERGDFDHLIHFMKETYTKVPGVADQ